MIKYILFSLLGSFCLAEKPTIVLLHSGEDPAFIQVRQSIQDVLYERQWIPKKIHLIIRNARNSPYIFNKMLQTECTSGRVCVVMGVSIHETHPLDVQWIVFNICSPVSAQKNIPNLIYQKNVLFDEGKLMKNIQEKYHVQKIGILTYQKKPQSPRPNTQYFVVEEPGDVEPMIKTINQSNIDVLYISPNHLLYSALNEIIKYSTKPIVTYYDTHKAGVGVVNMVDFKHEGRLIGEALANYLDKTAK